ncbi:putative methyltransferase [Tepidimonas sediminis]|uniref:Putative methyltransferase n=1 Tax=Tepidimonas sediminis TaxID=2588941 RepID=A0A554WGR6_9BURK|nr:methyltransferase, TIGR04325 family [Tepidimonas sediminis]TSE22739.1 putative methyltransferase [Tepidimonas sediminis]
MGLKNLIKDWMPPALMRVVQYTRKSGIRFEGDYPTWEAAAAQCTGYDSEHILAKVLDATLKVKRGEAAYERDSVIFDEIQYSWPVTAALMWAAAQNGGRLDVLDFGGALGSSYFQNYVFLVRLPQVRWAVVEQPHYVSVGRQYIQDDRLKFYDDIDTCLAVMRPSVILLSAVLQYLPNPMSIFKKIKEFGPEVVVIDRTPFWVNDGRPASVMVQYVPPSIYPASYPCWFFNYRETLVALSEIGYKKVEEFESLDKLTQLAEWRGLIATRRD